MEKIAVAGGFRRFRGLRVIDRFATRKAEHFGTFLALLADGSSQVIDVYIEGGLAGGLGSPATRMGRVTHEDSEEMALVSGNGIAACVGARTLTLDDLRI
jgi:hypothetical protein